MNEILTMFSEYIATHFAIIFTIFCVALLAEFGWYLFAEQAVPTPQISDTRKEQLKLRATLFNNLAIAMFSIGFVTPLVGALYGVLSAPPLFDVVSLGSGWLAAGIVFHFIGTAVLRGLGS